ncbi:hypothetical protein [Lysobacter sp. P5_B9]
MGDVLVAKDGATALDSVCVIREPIEAVLLSSVAILRANSDKVLPRYLRYYLDAEPTRQYMKAAFTTGAAIPRVVLRDFKRARIRYPNVDVQRRIVFVLSAYDDLIENNTRRVAVLEEMARRIYEEWFVRFRFPAKDELRIVETELGAIPDGWSIQPLSTMCDVTDYVANGSFASLKQNVIYRSEVDYAVLVRGTDFNSGWKGGYVYVPEHSYRFLRKSALQPGDIVVTNVGTVGTTFMVPDLGRPMTLGPNSVLAKPLKGRSFLFHFLRSDEGQHRIRGITSGSAQSKFNKTEFRALRIVVPADAVLDEFDRVVSPIHTLAEKLRAANTSLRSARDLILPRLISGELDVSELPEPEAAAA